MVNGSNTKPHAQHCYKLVHNTLVAIGHMKALEYGLLLLCTFSNSTSCNDISYHAIQITVKFIILCISTCQ